MMPTVLNGEGAGWTAEEGGHVRKSSARVCAQDKAQILQAASPK